MYLTEEFQDELKHQELDIAVLRKLLMDYYGTAMQSFPMAVIELSNIEDMSDDEIIVEAQKIGLL